MNFFDNIRRKVSGAWREPSVVVDLTEDSDGDDDQNSARSSSVSSGSSYNRVSVTSPMSSTGGTSRSAGSSSSSFSPIVSTPKNRLDSAKSTASLKGLAVTPVRPPSPEVRIVSLAPKAQPSALAPHTIKVLPKPNSGLAPISMNPVIPIVPTFTKKEESDAKKRADLTERIFTKKEQLKRLEKFQSNEALIRNLPDKGVKINQQIMGLRLELRAMYKSLKEMGELPPLNHFKEEPTTKAPVPVESHPATKKYQRPGDYAVAEALTGDALIQLHSTLRNLPEKAEDDGPQQLEVELLPHQKRALAWALWRECQHPKGGILADDMGLGKTLTMIALIMRSKELKRDNEENINASPAGYKALKKAQTLVVCPASVLKQWEAEILKRCEPRSLVPYVYHGNSRGISLNRLCRSDVVITSYAIVGREGKITQDFLPGREERPSGTLFQVRWERVILDEAHTIRNPKTQLAQGAYQLEAKCRWCLTGTPLHNKLKDIYSLFNFLKFTPFTNEMVWRRVAENKTSAGLERLNTVMKTVMLRRTKLELQEAGQLDCLPNKGVQEIPLKLSDEEQKIYTHMLNKSKTLMAKFILQRAEKMVETGEDIYAVRNAMAQLEKDGFTVKKGMHRSGEKVKASHILVLLLRLRQICCHMSLVKNKLDEDIMEAENIDTQEQSYDELVEEINNMSMMETGQKEAAVDDDDDFLDPDNTIFETEHPSTKTNAVIKLVQEVKERGEKVVVVSQWKSFLNIVNDQLKSTGIKATLFSGDLNTTKRQEIISDFNDEKGRIKVLLLSLTAGGTGVNLIGANNLVLIDIHWNPQLEAQAMDRIYRVGQKRDVNIFKMICQHSIESSIQLMQEKKLELADGVLNKKAPTKLNMEDLRLLFMNA